MTGCDTGFGNLAARRLDALGCHVFAGCLTEAGETDLSKSSSSRMQPVSLDVSKPDSVRRAFEIVKAKLSPGKGIWQKFTEFQALLFAKLYSNRLVIVSQEMSLLLSL